jgi:hypothetical protein
MVKTVKKPVPVKRPAKKATKKESWRNKALTEMSSTKKKNLCKTDRMTTTSTAMIHEKELNQVLINKIEPFNSATQLTPGGLKQNLRLRPMVNIRGWKINMMILNLNDWPVYFHYAIISPKAEADGSDLRIDFFRDFNASRDVSFMDGLTGSAFTRLPINTDKYAVLCHKKLFVPRALEGGWAHGSYENSNFRHIEMYQPFNRTVAFHDDSEEPEVPIFAVYWCCDPSVDTGVNPVQDAKVKIQHDVIAYYNELSA